MIGPLILDLEGKELSSVEAEMLNHPLVGGVILFTRNYESPEQLDHLCKTIRAVRKAPILITVDHEGGRVQRFREGFTHLPSMGTLGDIFAKNPEEALQLASACGWLAAAELLAFQIDLSFAPVLDLNLGVSPVIGNRAFGANPLIVTELANAFIVGMKSAGMASVGKHFPGHGSVHLDSHIAMPEDDRSLEAIFQQDLIPFKNLIQSKIPAIMPAHIIFSRVDKKPTGFSSIWLKDILREQLKFTGVIISDDLSMKGAECIGEMPARADEALRAGCDMVLICNNRDGAIKTLDNLAQNYFLKDEKFKLLQGQFHYSHQSLRNSPQWKQQSERLKGLL